jgi:hypothetical protein
MTLDTCIAHAIHKDLDIVEACPELQDMGVDDLEGYVENFVSDAHEDICELLTDLGPNIKTKTSAELGIYLFEHLPYVLPLPMLTKMCETIKTLQLMDAKFILDTPDQCSLYSVRLDVNFGAPRPAEPQKEVKVPDIFLSAQFANAL